MDGNQARFIPPGSPNWSPETSGYTQAERLECDHCGSYINEGDEAVEILHGSATPGAKSGRLMVQENPNVTSVSVAVVHPECAGEYIRYSVCDWVEDDLHLCQACEARIEEDS